MDTQQKPSDNHKGNDSSRALRRVAIWVLVAVLVGLAWFVATEKPYTAGDAIGYNLGLVGGCMMLLLLVYSLRKRLRFLDKIGSIRHYFSFHMFLGIAGPILVLFHTTFQIGSVNSRIALYSMLLVAGSGLIGRFVYRHIHHGLYGRQATLAEAEEELNSSAASVHSMLSIAPGIEKKLDNFRSYSIRILEGAWAPSWRFMTLRMRGHILAHSVRKEMRKAMEKSGRAKHLCDDEIAAQQKLAAELIGDYVEAVCSAATYAVWVRLFALWHIVHVPFLYLLIVTATIHVVATNFLY